MTRIVSRLYEARENDEIQQKQLELKGFEERLQHNAPEILRMAGLIEQSIDLINKSTNEQNASLIEAITGLEEIIANETDPILLLKKYGALSSMLETTVIKKASVQDKAAAMELFLKEFQKPSSKFKSNVKLGVAISSFVLLIGLGIAATFIVPMIPFATAFAFLGLSGTALSIAAVSSKIVVQFGGVIAFSILLNKMNEVVTNTLSNLLTSFTSECKAAKALHTNIRSNLFFAEEPQQGRGCEGAESFAPLLS